MSDPLQDAIRAYFASSLPAQSKYENQIDADRLYRSGECYLSTDAIPVLCIRARNQSAGNIGGNHLPTRITSGAATVLAALRELFDRGVLTSTGLAIHDNAEAGVHIQTEGS